MWTIRVRWKAIFQLLYCSWAGHDWDQYFPINVWASSDHYCRRCRVARPSRRMFHERLGGGKARHSYVHLDQFGRPVGERIITGSNVQGDLFR